MSLPYIPLYGEPSVTLQGLQAIEARVAVSIAQAEDLIELENCRARAATLARRFIYTDLAAPLHGIQRRVEGRIGQLLRDDKQPELRALFTQGDQVRFRRLARGLDAGLSAAQWCTDRETLARLIQSKYSPARVVKKSRSETSANIATLAATGARPEQIAAKLKVSVAHVKRVAHAENIEVHDAVTSYRRKPNARRIIEQTILGVSAYVDGLQILDELGALPTLEAAQVSDWLGALNGSINGLKKLHRRLKDAA